MLPRAIVIGTMCGTYYYERMMLVCAAVALLGFQLDIAKRIVSDQRVHATP